MKSIKLPSWLERALGLEAQLVPPHVFAIDAESLRFATFQAEGGRLRLRAAGRHEWPTQVFGSGPLGGPVVAAEFLREGIDALLRLADEPVKEAALVLPDAWLRTVFAGLNELPAPGRGRNEVLRWKLKQLVPFRVEELRLRGIEVPQLPGEDSACRVLLGFAVEQLLEDLESNFAAAGVRIGWMGSETLATVTSHEDSRASVAAGDFAATLLIRPGSYSLAVVLQSKPILLRFKPVDASIDPQVLLRMVQREMVLTADFLAEKFPEGRLAGVTVLAHGAAESWVAMIEQALGVPSTVLSPEVFSRVDLERTSLPWYELAPMVGASQQTVA